METNYNQITKNIWIGNYISAYDNNFLQKNNIKNIINVTPDISNKFNKIKYLTIPIKNDELYGHILQSYSYEILKFIDNAIQRNENVLVHCKKGHTRSATVVAYYLVNRYNMNLDDAKKYIKNIRPTTFVSKLNIEKSLYNIYK